ncbi:MAG: molybdate ABC transporter substrate-binding protein [Candidatus Omnitrophota bacterium]
MMKNKIIIIFSILILGVFVITSYNMNSYKRIPIEIYVPCGMIVPFQEAIHSFEAENSGTKIKAYYDTGSVLVKLILNKGRRPDIFVSPGDVEMKNLIDNDVVDQDTITDLGRFNLVLYASSANPGNISSLDDLIKPEVKNIAISDPRFNSVGSYAKEALVNAGIWDAVKNKIISTDSPIQALTFVSTGKAQAGIHYDTCPFETAPQKMNIETLKIIEVIPQKYYRPIKSQIAILNGTKNKKLSSLLIGRIVSKPAIKKDSAKVRIEAYYPFNEEHKFIGEYLKTFENKYPGRVSVRLIDFRSSDGYDEWRSTGLSCGGIIINGKSEFDIDTPEGRKNIRFLRRLETFWSREDFEKVIEKEVSK